MTTSKFWDRATVILVTYNSRHAIEPCLDQLTSAPHLVIVDNASDDDTVARVRQRRPDAHVVRNPANYGFATAANQGFSLVETDYGINLNLDTVITDEMVSCLVAAMDGDPHAGIVAPVLFNRAGHVDLAIMGPYERHHHPLRTMPDGDFCTWFATGCVILVRLSAWRDIGGFDERIFLYNDDVDFCLRLTRAGHGILVLRDASAIHVGGQSSRITWRVRWRKGWHMTWSHLYLELKHGDPARAAADARRLMMRHALRFFISALTIRPRRAFDNLARAFGAGAFLLGRPAWPGR